MRRHNKRLRGGVLPHRRKHRPQEAGGWAGAAGGLGQAGRLRRRERRLADEG